MPGGRGVLCGAARARPRWALTTLVMVFLWCGDVQQMRLFLRLFVPRVFTPPPAPTHPRQPQLQQLNYGTRPSHHIHALLLPTPLQPPAGNHGEHVTPLLARARTIPLPHLPRETPRPHGPGLDLALLQTIPLHPCTLQTEPAAAELIV